MIIDNSSPNKRRSQPDESHPSKRLKITDDFVNVSDVDLEDISSDEFLLEDDERRPQPQDHLTQTNDAVGTQMSDGTSNNQTSSTSTQVWSHPSTQSSSISTQTQNASSSLTFGNVARNSSRILPRYSMAEDRQYMRNTSTPINPRPEVNQAPQHPTSREESDSTESSNEEVERTNRQNIQSSKQPSNRSRPTAKGESSSSSSSEASSEEEVEQENQNRQNNFTDVRVKQERIDKNISSVSIALKKEKSTPTKKLNPLWQGLTVTPDINLTKQISPKTRQPLKQNSSARKDQSSSTSSTDSSEDEGEAMTHQKTGPPKQFVRKPVLPATLKNNQSSSKTAKQKPSSSSTSTSEEEGEVTMTRQKNIPLKHVQSKTLSASKPASKAASQTSSSSSSSSSSSDEEDVTEASKATGAKPSIVLPIWMTSRSTSINHYWKKGLTEGNKEDANLPPYAIFNPRHPPKPVSTSDDDSSENEVEDHGGRSIPAPVATHFSSQSRSANHSWRPGGGNPYFSNRPKNASEARLAAVAAKIQLKDASKAIAASSTPTSAGPTNSTSIAGTKTLPSLVR